MSLTKHTVYRCRPELMDMDKDGRESACGWDGESVDRSYDECHHPLSLKQTTYMVAAWNACEEAGLSLESLEGGIIQRLVQKAKSESCDLSGKAG